jgi:GDPmannose 4,6-dehydratase
MSKSIVIGHAGQDGVFLSRRLWALGDQVIGVGRGDLNLLDADEVRSFLLRENPDFVYYLAAHHHSSEDRELPADGELFRRSFDVHVHGAISFLDAIALYAPKTRFFYAASSHVFGAAMESPQTDATPFRPQNVYAISKCAGVEACRFYRTKHGIHASCGILYNHESELRSERFVSQKIVRGAVAVSRGEIGGIRLGDLDARIDWGYAPDYVEAMTMILAEESPDDYVVASGIARTVREFASVAFSKLGLDWEKHVTVDPDIISNEPMPILVGNATKLKSRTGWFPKTSFDQMIDKMILAALHER